MSHRGSKYSDYPNSQQAGTPWALIEPFHIQPDERLRRQSFQDVSQVKASIAFNTSAGVEGIVDGKRVRVQLLTGGYQVTHCDCQPTAATDPTTGLTALPTMCVHAQALICSPISPSSDIISGLGNLMNSPKFIQVCQSIIQSLIFEKSQIVMQDSRLAELFDQFSATFPPLNEFLESSFNMDKILAACSTQYRLSIAESQISSVVVVDGDLGQMGYVNNSDEGLFKFESAEWERLHNENSLVWIVSNTNTGDKCVIGYNIDARVNFPQITSCSSCHQSFSPLLGHDKNSGAPVNPTPGSICEHVCAALSTVKKAIVSKEWPDTPVPSHAIAWNYVALKQFLESKSVDQLLLRSLVDFLTMDAQNIGLFLHAFPVHVYSDSILKAIKDASAKPIDAAPHSESATQTPHQALTQSQNLIASLFVQEGIKEAQKHPQQHLQNVIVATSPHMQAQPSANGPMPHPQNVIVATPPHMQMAHAVDPHAAIHSMVQKAPPQVAPIVSPQGRPVRNRKRKRYDESEDDEDDEMEEDHAPKRQRGGRKGAAGASRGRPRKSYDDGLHTPMGQQHMHYAASQLPQDQMYHSAHQQDPNMAASTPGGPTPVLYNNGEPMRLRMFREYVAPEFVQLVLNQNMNDHDIIQHFHAKFPEAKKFVTGHSIWCVRNGVTYTKLSGIAKNKNTKKRQKTANGKQTQAPPPAAAQNQDDDEDDEQDEAELARPAGRSAVVNRPVVVQQPHIDPNHHAHHPGMTLHASHPSSRPPSSVSPPTSPFNMPTFDNLHPLPSAYVPFPAAPPMPTGVTNAQGGPPLDGHHHHHQMSHHQHGLHHFSPYMAHPTGRLEPPSDLTSSQGAAVAAINALRTANH